MSPQGLEEKSIVTASPDSTIQEIAQLLARQNVGCVVIVEDEKPVGIITDRDIVVSVVEEGRAPELVRAGNVMTEDPITVEVGTGLFEITRIMAEHGFRRLPMTKDGVAVSIITLDDIHRVLTREITHLSQVLEEESPRKSALQTT